jgi:hypothetical protein
METKTIEVCDALHVDVSCERNDSTDIKCGGPAMLGYDFFVSPDEEIADLMNFIHYCIKKYHRPFIGIATSEKKNFPVENLWTREMIEKCIKENAI